MLNNVGDETPWLIYCTKFCTAHLCLKFDIFSRSTVALYMPCIRMFLNDTVSGVFVWCWMLTCYLMPSCLINGHLLPPSSPTHTSTPTTEATGSSETLVPMYQNTRLHIPEHIIFITTATWTSDLTRRKHYDCLWRTERRRQETVVAEENRDFNPGFPKYEAQILISSQRIFMIHVVPSWQVFFGHLGCRNKEGPFLGRLVRSRPMISHLNCFISVKSLII